MKVMLIHVLSLMLTIRVGFSSPVGFLDSFFELISYEDQANDTVDGSLGLSTFIGSLGQGRWFTDDSVNYLGDAFNVADIHSCCQECQKYYFDTTAYGFSKKSFNRNDCACLKPAEGRRLETRKAGEVSGKCGVWNYQGDGALGDDRYFQSGVTSLGVMPGVNDAAECCDGCQRRFPGTQLFTFYKGKDYCSCHKTIPGQYTVTRGNTYAAGICAARPITVNKVTKTEDLMMGDAPVAPNEPVSNQVLLDHDEAGVVGAVGEGRTFKLDTVEYRGDIKNVTSAEESKRCCKDCQKEWKDSHLYIFSKKKNMCYCYAQMEGKKPETAASSKFFSSVCHSQVDEKKKA